MGDLIRVEVVCAMPDRQLLREVSLPAGSCVIQAVERSGILEDLPELVFDPACLGIFSQRVAADRVLQHGDRVEIYRPLTRDPREARRRRAR